MSDTKHVLVIQPISPLALELLDARSDITYEVLSDVSLEAIAARTPYADAITLRDARLPAAALQDAGRLKIVSRHGVGYDNVPIDLLSARGVPVTVIGDVNSVSVAEHTLFLMLAAAKNGARFDRAIRAGDFAIRSRQTTVQLKGKTVLMVGYGRIAQEFARLAGPLGMAIAAYDPFMESNAHLGVRFYDDLLEGLRAADVVSLHLPLTPATRNLIDTTAIAAMKSSAILVNAARGGIVDEAALLAALNGGRLHAAGLDVFGREPLPADDPLLSAENLVLSPHNAALTEECLVEMGRATISNVLAAFAGTLDSRYVVNRDALCL